MSSGIPLQLFPAPPSKNGRPKRKTSRRYPTKPTSPVTVIERSKSPVDAQEIIIRVSTESTRPSIIASPAKAHVIDQPRRSYTPSIAPSGTTRAASPALTNNQSILSGSPTLVRANSAASNFVPMRSMFPRYNPNLPLSQQQYEPTQASPTNISREHISKAAYSPSIYSPQNCVAGPSSAPSNSSTFPPGAMNTVQPRYSSVSELTHLWEAANGQTSQKSGRLCTLQMSRDGAVDLKPNTILPTTQECYSFGASKTQPFYDLQTLKQNPTDTTFSECIIRRRKPCLGGPIVPVVTLYLESRTRHKAPQDGLITTIYPRLAAMMALDKSSSSIEAISQAQEYKQEESIRNAAANERCSLICDSSTQKYTLQHPTLANGKPQSFNIHTSSSTSSTSSSLSEVGFDIPNAKGKINLSLPSLNAETDDSDFVTLDFATSSLIINTAVASQLQNLYIIDVAVSAVLTVALVEGRRLRERRFLAPPSSSTILSVGPVGVTDGGESGAIIADDPRIAATTDAAKIDEGLPKATQGVLSLLFLLFRFVVWGLGVLVGMLAAVVVGISACFCK
ncbi:MAG: hypothetical protein M1827_005748 [Pycnora praestabilis]|nr:MAG: hypothetical protein M1827_005748 [Pycnora praestabilis]